MLIADRYAPTGNAQWGGMSEVHECMDNSLSRKVMLKRLIQAGDVGRLVDEKKALMKVRSRHVVEMLDIVTYDMMGVEETAIILEKIDGKKLVEGALPFGEEYLKTIWQIISGIADIHDAGIIHRDIKPDNILIDHSGVVKILDFGLARELDKDNKTRSIIGTPLFMAPELYGDTTRVFGNAIDIYAFAVTALQLTQPPQQVVGKTISDKVETLFRTLDGALTDLLKRCLNSNPNDRPKASEIEAFLKRRLTRNLHRARLINGVTIIEINKQSPQAGLKTKAEELHIKYDGENFVCSKITGSMSVNNIPLQVGDNIENSCVIIFGGQGSKNRAFVPCDISHPEVML